MSSRPARSRGLLITAAFVLLAVVLGWRVAAVVAGLGLLLLASSRVRRSRDRPRDRGRGSGPVVGGLLVLGLVTAVGVAFVVTDRRPAPPAGSALEALGALDVVRHDTSTPYDRDSFAYRAFDLDRNGCDTRNDVLNRDLTELRHRPGTGGCVVETGTLADPYSGQQIDFRRGATTSDDVQIDHVVSLHNAWRTGASDWDAATLQRFGNDPLNLLAVDGSLNGAKGNADAASWLPPDEDVHCPFVARQVAVKTVYGLGVTRAERDAMAEVLDRCPDHPVPTG